MSDILSGVYNNFVEDHRFLYLLQGLGNTIIISIFAVLIGTTLGFFIAIVRSAHDRAQFSNKIVKYVINLLNTVLKTYVTIIRGTPTMIQLLIMYYIIFATVDAKMLVAILAFGLNSSAYVSEIVRSGIMSVDQGQFEAGRSIGFDYNQTMRYIILPQAVKNILPALANEFIVLIKETSISGYVGIMDLTRGGDIIRSITYTAYLPLLTVALIYLILVVALSAGVEKLERKLRSNER